MNVRLGDQLRIASTQIEETTTASEAANTETKPIVEQPTPKPLTAQDSGIRKAELAFGGSTMAALLNSKLGQVATPDPVGETSSDPVQNDPAFQKLPAETKQQVMTDLRNAPDENAKANIRKLATDENFGSLSPQTQKEALQSLGEDPASDARLNSVRAACKDMQSVEQMGNYKGLSEDTKAHFRTSMFHFSGNESVRDGLINFVQNDSFGKMSSTNQKLVIDTYLANPTAHPSGNTNAIYLGNMISSPAFQKMDDAQEAQVLGMVRNTAGDEKGVQAFDKLLHDSNFAHISPESQKAALEDLADNPSSDAHASGVRQTCSDMAHLEGSMDFQKLPRDTQAAMRTDMFHFSGNETTRNTLIGFAHNPNFAKLSTDNQQRLMGAFLTNQTETNGSTLNNIIASSSFQKMDEQTQRQVIALASRNSANEANMQSVDKLLRDSNFEQLSPAGQKAALDSMDELSSSAKPAELAKNIRQTCGDMIHMENSSNFNNLSPDSQAAFRTALFNNAGRENVRDSLIFMADNPNMLKMSSANQQRALGAFLRTPTENNASFINNMIAAGSFQSMDEGLQQHVLTLASRNADNDQRMQEMSDLLRDPGFVNASSEDQYNQLRPFEVHDPNAEF